MHHISQHVIARYCGGSIGLRRDHSRSETDSREVASGDAFIALSGAKTPADFYVDKAITAGATVILLETEQAGECAEHHGALIVPVAGLRGLVGRIADRFFEHPSQRLRLIGVTGTNGKTSVCQYVAQLLKETGTPCGILGTLGYGMPGSLQPATHTTPDAVQVNRVLSRIVKQEGRAAVMEVSSHALDQGRVDNISMTGAVFTNLTGIISTITAPWKPMVRPRHASSNERSCTFR